MKDRPDYLHLGSFVQQEA